MQQEAELCKSLLEADLMSRFDDVEKQSEILKRVASAYAPESEEESAVRLAAFALIFVTMEHAEEFKKFFKGQSRRVTANSGSRFKLKLQTVNSTGNCELATANFPRHPLIYSADA